MAKLVRISDISAEDIASVCDHTYLNRPEAFRGKAENPVMQRREDFYKFMKDMIDSPIKPYAVCVRAEDIKHAGEMLKEHNNEGIVLAAVVGFPDGAWYTTDFKVAEAKLAVKYGATEVDMVLNYELLKEGSLKAVKKDILSVVNKAHSLNALAKIIFETSELTNYDIVNCCKLAEECNADFVKTSTGFSSSGAKAEGLKLMRENFSKGVKMSGGVNAENVKSLLEAVSGRDDGMIELDPMRVRIGESSLIAALLKK